MREKRRIPYGVGNWAKLVRDDKYFYVDHTAYIRALERYDTPVFLRPRRFGKTMWCSILECYYDVGMKKDFAKLFGKTDIGRNPTELRNSFLILRLNFSLVEVGETGDLDRIERSFDFHVTNRVGSFAVYYRKIADFRRAAKAKTAIEAIQCIRRALCDARASGKDVPPVYLIIDEYDNFMNQLIVARRDGDYEKLVSKTSFLKNFFKAVKAGMEEDGVVGKTYITGVLPVVLDDLTSGFNIAKMVNLESELLGMLGFTQRDVDRYVDEIYADYGFDPATKAPLIAELKSLYDNYRFLPQQKESIYNSTILNYYLDEFTLHDGTPPENPIDGNVRTDVSWLARLTGNGAGALEDIRTLVECDGRLPVPTERLDPHAFTKANFFNKAYFGAALYYLGMLSYDPKGMRSMMLPNLTLRRIMLGYYDELQQYFSGTRHEDAFNEATEAFAANGDWPKLMAAYWKNYVGRIPARSFGNLTEAFFQLSFADLCWRNLPSLYSAHVEPNLHSGLADFVAYPVTDDDRKICVIEFKYRKARGKREEERGARAQVTAADKRQVAAYAADVKNLYPQREVEAYVCSIVGNRSYSFRKVEV